MSVAHPFSIQYVAALLLGVLFPLYRGTAACAPWVAAYGLPRRVWAACSPPAIHIIRRIRLTTEPPIRVYLGYLNHASSTYIAQTTHLNHTIEGWEILKGGWTLTGVHLIPQKGDTPIWGILAYSLGGGVSSF